jgi:hypothetical protein
LNPKKVQGTMESPAFKLVTYRVSSQNGVSLLIDAYSPEEAKRRYRDSLMLSQLRPDSQFTAIPVE